VVLGGGGHARVVADACRAAGHQVRGFIDPHLTPGDRTGGILVLGNDELLESSEFVATHDFIVGIGDYQVRRRLAGLVTKKGGLLITIAHPSSVIAPDIRIGVGTVLFAGSVVNTGSLLGEFVIVNTGATVDHDCVLAEGVHICPGAHLAGAVICGIAAFVGTGAVVIPNRRIGASAVVGAGAVVIDDVPEGATVIGCPARIVGSSRDRLFRGHRE